MVGGFVVLFCFVNKIFLNSITMLFVMIVQPTNSVCTPLTILGFTNSIYMIPVSNVELIVIIIITLCVCLIK